MNVSNEDSVHSITGDDMTITASKTITLNEFEAFKEGLRVDMIAFDRK